VAKALTSAKLTLTSEPKLTRSAAMLGLLEATEQRIAEVVWMQKTIARDSSDGNIAKKVPNPASSPEPKVIRMPTNDNVSIDYGEKPKEKSFMPWRKASRVESSYARNIYQ
jgi:hypothetical protein